jgi:hypothetical protein
MRNIGGREFPRVQIRRAQRRVVDMQLIRLKLIKICGLFLIWLRGLHKAKMII